jgi:putative transposase
MQVSVSACSTAPEDGDGVPYRCAVDRARVIQAYRYALDPTVDQVAALRSHCGGQRFAYNWGLALVKANLDQRQAEASYGLSDAELVPALSWSAYSLRKLWNQVKGTIAPWWVENSKECYASGLVNLAAALKNWHDSRSGRRGGPRVRFPRWKGKRAAMSCRFTTGAFGLAKDSRHVKLPRIGLVRTQESTRKLTRRVKCGIARIRSATVTHRAGKWFVSFSVEVERVDPTPAKPESVIGVDLGLRSLAVLSTGQVITNPKHLEAAQRELRRLQRQASRRAGPDRRTLQQPSRRWRRTQARVAKLHDRVANARRNGLHTLTSRLVREHGTVVIEDLNVSGLLRNKRLARHIAGVGMGELRRQLTYKTTWYHGRLVIADRWYPSSKTCSDCGAVKTKLHLSERRYTCDQCGLVLDRDLNAARNLAQLVGTSEGDMSSPSCGVTRNEPDGNPHQTCFTQAAGTATGRPGRTARSTPHHKVTATRTERTHVRSRLR